MKLDTIQTSSGRYFLVEADNVPVILHDSGIDIGDHDQAHMLEHAVLVTMTDNSEFASGVCVGPEIGLDFLTDKAETAGTILRLNHQDIQPSYKQLPTMIQGWGVEHVANNYGVAKLDLWYNPDDPNSLDKKKLVAEIHEFCQQSGIELFLQLKIFLIAEESRSFAELQLEAVREMSRYCDLIGLEYPESTLAAATISAEIDIPWILVNGTTVGYEQFKQQVRDCLDSGAAGCFVDQLLWSGLLDRVQDADNTITAEMISEFSQEVGRDRMMELARVIDES